MLAEPPNMIDIVPTILDAAGAPAIVGRPRKTRAQRRD
jgi:arylsulfatase A-like enzyme